MHIAGFVNQSIKSEVPDIMSSFSSLGTIDKNLDHFPLDMDEAAKLLDKHDLNDVLNKLPEEPFDLFNGGSFVISEHLNIGYLSKI